MKLPFWLGEPQLAGPLAVYPVFGADPRMRYIGLAEALGSGASLPNAGEQHRARELQIHNASAHALLVYGGQAIPGAHRAQALEDPLLIPAGAESAIPVAVSGKPLERAPIERFLRMIVHVPGQLGALVLVSGRPVALDLVSRQEVFAQLLPQLAEGYALKALDARAAEPHRSAPHGFLAACLQAHRTPLRTRGLGRMFVLSQPGLRGSGLWAARELLALSAVASEKTVKPC